MRQRERAARDKAECQTANFVHGGFPFSSAQPPAAAVYLSATILSSTAICRRTGAVPKDVPHFSRFF
jgi:hypothetical protein